MSLVFFTVTADAADVSKSKAAREDEINFKVVIVLLLSRLRRVVAPYVGK